MARAIAHTAIADGVAAQALPSIPAGTVAVKLQATLGDYYYRLDAVNPSASVGFILPANQAILVTEKIADIRVMEKDAAALLQICYFSES
jgi:hypothetical protein